MARFLISVWPALGHVYPAIAVARALTQEGHSAAVHTIPAHAHLLDTMGLQRLPLSGVPGVDEHGVTPRDEHRGPLVMKQAFRQRFVETVPAWLDSLSDAIECCSPDVLINDTVTFAPLIAAERRGLPIATLCHTVLNWPGERFGPFGPGLPPANDGATRLRYAEMRAQGEAFFSDIVAALNSMRIAAGLPARQGSLPVATLSPYLQMVTTIPVLDFERDDLPPQVHYIGPCSFDPPAALDPDTAQWLDALPRDLPLVLVAASSVFTRSAALVEAAVEGLADANVAVLATLPQNHRLHQLPPSAPHTHVVRFAPHSAVLPRASLVVSHGGNGLIAKALSHGRPLVLTPFGADQAEAAQRVVAAGAGVRLGLTQLTPETLRATVNSALSDPALQVSAQRIADDLRRYDGPRTAAILLARLAATGQPIHVVARMSDKTTYTVSSVAG